MERAPRLPAGIVGALTLVTIGWTGLVVPSLIRSIKATFAQDDVGIGLVYLLWSIAYAVGSFGGGALTERAGRRPVLGAATLVHGVGVAGLGVAGMGDDPSWGLFLVAALVAGGAAGCLDGGANGLVLDVYRDGRGRAMNLLHMAFSVGALAAPLVVGALVEGGIAWQAVVVATGAIAALLAAAYGLVPMPTGKRTAQAAGAQRVAGGEAGGGRPRWLLAGPLLLLGVAIAAYVASEVGVSNWIVRFLEPAPLTTATLALSLYWAGLAVGRLVSSAIADRFDHLRFTIAMALGMSGLIVCAVLAPSLPISIVAFAAAGVASGPIFPMIVALGGEHRPDRSAAVGGSLTGMAVVGSTIYPPVMGVLSVTVGLPAAMLGTAVLAVGSAIALVAFGRVRGRPGRTP
ncbi:MAG: MFS transporter [Chloroflexota bacterium]